MIHNYIDNYKNYEIPCIHICITHICITHIIYTIYRETTILYDEDKSPIDKLYIIASNIIYQTTHQWFGNTVSPTWWTHIWINDGFAEYFTYHIIDKVGIDNFMQ